MILLCLFLININADTILDTTESHYLDLKSYYVEFIQVACNKEAGTCERYIGKVAYKAPNKMRMEIEGAMNLIELYDGEWYWSYRPKEGKLIKQKLSKPLFDLDLENLIKDYRERFDYRLIKKTPPYEIEFLPKEDDDAISRLVIIISKSFLIKGLIITDPSGNESKFDFNRFTLNRDIPDKIFTLRLPEGVEVIEE